MSASSDGTSRRILVPVAELRRSDLLHLGGSVYALVAGIRPIDAVLAEVSVFDGDQARPETEPRAWTDTVPAAHRGITAPLTAAVAAVQARRHASALALMDRIRHRTGPVTGVDDEIDRIRGRHPAPPDPTTAGSVPGLLDVLTCHRGDGPLLLDAGQPAVRAVVALFVELKDGEDCDSGPSGRRPVAARPGVGPSARSPVAPHRTEGGRSRRRR